MHLSVTPKSSMSFDSRSRGTSRGQTPVPSRGATPAPAPTEHHDLDPKYDHYDYPTGCAQAQSGHPGHTTKEQDAAVHQLRMILEAEGCSPKNLDTLTLLRFLRARKFDVMQTKTMFMNCEKWRSEFHGGVDKLVRDFDYTEKELVMAYYPQYYHKTDKDGRPLYIEQLGKVDLEAMRKVTTDERMLQNLVVEYEKAADPRLPACSRKQGHLLETSCTIMDLKGVGLYSAGQYYAYLQMASSILQNYYPERLGKLYCINAPWGFSSVFSVVKRFLDPVTVAKIHILGTNYLPELLAQIDKENLPSEFGGDCRCPGGCALADVGPWKDPQFARPPAWANEGAQGDVHVPETIPEGQVAELGKTNGQSEVKPEIKIDDTAATQSATKEGAAPSVPAK